MDVQCRTSSVDTLYPRFLDGSEDAGLSLRRIASESTSIKELETSSSGSKSGEYSRAQRVQLNLLVHRSNAKVFSVNYEGLIDSWNDGMKDLIGVSDVDAVGKTIDDIFLEESPIINWINNALKGGESLYEMTSVSRNSIDKNILANALPRFADNDMDVIGAVCIIWNVTSLSEAQVHELISADSEYREQINAIASDMRKLSETLEMKRNFVRGVSHEIRTPLNVVLAGLQLIESQFVNQISSEVLNLIKEIKQSCTDGVDILDDLLAYEKLDGKIITADKEPVSANALVKECLQPFQMQARLSNVDLQYSESLIVGNPPQISEDLMIFVDHFKIRQVTRNLISNAVKFTPGGKVSCRVSWTDQSTQRTLTCAKGFVHIAVTDNGVGLSEEHQRKLFKEIIQFNAAVHQKGGGSGLGLFVSQSLVTLNGGIIGVQSPGLGQGSTFYFEFPLFDAKPLIESNEGLPSSVVRRSSREFHPSELRLHSFNRKDMRILIVDDSTLSRKMVAQLLRPHFCELVEACDGIDAVTKYQTAVVAGNSWDVILMDSDMPKV
jgi:PAS domain S-box-containing protein